MVTCHYMLLIENVCLPLGDIELERVLPYLPTWDAVVEVCNNIRENREVNAFIIIRAATPQALSQGYNLLAQGYSIDDILAKVPGMYSSMRVTGPVGGVDPGPIARPASPVQDKPPFASMMERLGAAAETTQGTVGPAKFLTPDLKPVEPEDKVYEPDEAMRKRWEFTKLMVERGVFNESLQEGEDEFDGQESQAS